MIRLLRPITFNIDRDRPQANPLSTRWQLFAHQHLGCCLGNFLTALIAANPGETYDPAVVVWLCRPWRSRSTPTTGCLLPGPVR